MIPYPGYLRWRSGKGAQGVCGSVHRRHGGYTGGRGSSQTAEYFGCRVDRIFDVGVAGIHRLLARGSVWTRPAALWQWPEWKERWAR